MALIIIACILAIIILLLNIPVVLTFKADHNTNFSIKVLFFTIFPLKEKKKIGEQKPQKKKGAYLKEYIEKNGFKNSISKIFEYLKIFLSSLKTIDKKIKITNFDCKITVGGNDAADTAIQYGAVCAVVYPFVNFLATITDFNFNDIVVNSDFDSGKYEIYLFFMVKIKIIYLLKMVFDIIIKIIKNKKEVQK